MEEDADFGVERRAARHQRLHPAAETLLDFRPEQPVEDQVDRAIENAHAPLIILFADAQRLVQHPVRELALLFDRLDHPRTDHLEQAREDRSEEPTSEIKSLIRNSYAAYVIKK